jgi:predicted RNase H-like HicB family nuclease
MKFLITLTLDEDRMWVAECPSIPGCVSQGQSRNEAIENVREAIAACLEVGADAVQIFGKAGWTVDRQRGSHVILVKDGHIATLSVPDHKELARGTLRSLIRAAGMTTEDFESLAKD